MKRRNVECGKLRRPLKRNKLTEGIYGSTLLYLKFLLLWAMVILADFILEFRFEFLWPFWLLLRSVYDSFKYQGLAFSVFFICIALTSDMICFFFIPVHWLFFAASTYVWVQYVWHTDKGVCLPTVMLWLLFLYIEAAVRLRDLRHMPFHLDLCRPFAAHCIGYPVVTLGFGFKSYVGFRMRQRKRKDVAKENEFYLQLLQQALPLEQQAMSMQQIQQVQAHIVTSIEQHVKTQTHKLSPQYNPSPEKSRGRGSNNSVETNVQNGGVHNSSQITSQTHSVGNKTTHRKSLDKGEKQEEQHNKHNVSSISPSDKSDKKFIHSNCSTVTHSDIQLIERVGSVNDFDVNEVEKDKSIKGCGHTTIKSQSNGSVTGKWNNVKENRDSSSTTSVQRERKTRQVKNAGDTTTEQKQQDDYCQRLEADIKRLKSDLQSSRQLEQELRSQINTLLNGERQAKGDIQQLQHDNDQLQSKLHGLVTARQLDKQTMSSLEKRIAEERKQRTACEASLVSERRARRAAEEARSAIPPPPPPLIRQECTDACKSRRSQMEQDLKNLRRELKSKEERCNALEKDAARCKENHRESEILLSALNALQDKNAHLENSLSAETRIKLDLFSALGEVKRQLEIRESLIRSQEKEIEMLKTKIAQDLAVMPQDTFGPAPTCATSKLRLNSEVRVAGTKIRSNESPCPGCTVSNLDPNATAYTPKGSLVASTEA
ncbi:macoilin-1 isoform X3 [Odontomachus brunneus]|uniref:macoilin-1 isoform X3 n=1 Tax=Odontomachus brunneus TaxID=486640 RepID=UPI0013F268BF|nr:macoilin-1 isoform X3 [Odontomachus brunneus]